MAGVKSLLFSLIVVFLSVIGVLDIITHFKNNECEMTYMFEMPEYIRIPMKKAINQKYPKYGLHVYGEGNYAKMLGDMNVIGIPVLFIPGNAGSHKQVRSLGSVAFRRAIDKRIRHSFNYFSVDLNEEFSALYGFHLQEQTEFVHHAIKKIFSLYKNSENPPSSIILAGHSMGGMIARALFTLPDFDSSTVHTVIMQATPNLSPVLALDPQISSFYNKVNTYWRDHHNSTLSNVVLVSIAGGEKDIQVRTGLSLLTGIVNRNQAITTTTPSVPKGWTSTDHLCIVWCKQIVLAITRALYDIVDAKKKQVRDDFDLRTSVFQHHLINNPGSNGYVAKWPGEITLKKDIKWTLKTENVWKYEVDESRREIYFSMPVLEAEADYAVIVTNVEVDSWVCACQLKNDEKQCSTCRDLSSTGHLIPPASTFDHNNEKIHRKTVSIDLNDESLQDMTHIVIIVPASRNRIEVTAEMFSQGTRHLTNSLPGLLEVIMSWPESVVKGSMILDLGTQASFYKLKLYGLTSLLKVYTAELVTKECTDSKPDKFAGSVMRFHVPWNNEDTYTYIKYGQNGNISLKLQVAPPVPVITLGPHGFPEEGPDSDLVTDYVILELHLDPTCRYSLHLKASFSEMLGQFVRFYAVVLPAFCVAALLISLVHQLNTISSDGVCPSVLESIWAIKPYTVIPFVAIFSAILQIKAVRQYTENLGLPDVDSVSLHNKGLWFRGAELLFYLLALGVVTVQALVLNFIMQFNSRLLGLTFGWLPGAVVKLFQLCLLLLCVTGIGLSALVCSSTGIFISYVVCLIQLLRLCHRTRTTPGAVADSKYKFFLLLFMIWMWLVVLNFAPMLVWGRSMQISQKFEILRGDPSRLLGSIAAITFLCLLMFDSPLAGRKAYTVVAMYIRILVILMLMFGIETLYRISYVIVVCLVAVAVPHVVTVFRGKEKETDKPKTE